MKVCLVSLSRKRHKYFTLLAENAPGGCGANVVAGMRLNWTFLKSLLHSPQKLGFERIHTRRQQINYPLLHAFMPLSKLILLAHSYFETVRYHYFKCLFQGGHYQLLGIWNGQKPPYSTVAKAAIDCGMQVTYFENGGLPDTTTVDNKGVNAWNSLPKNIDFYHNYISEHQLIMDRKSQKESIAYGNKNHKYIFVDHHL